MEQWLHELHFDDSGACLPHASHERSERQTASARANGTAAGTAAADTLTPSGCASKHSVASPQRGQQQLETLLSTPWTPTPVTPQELHATTAVNTTASAIARALTFETYLSVPPVCVFQCARSRTDAALLYDVSCVAIEMDAVIESVHEQLQDYQRICEWLHSTEQQQQQQQLNAHRTTISSQADVMATALLALQQQARDVTERSLLVLLARLQQCLQKLYDLQFPLAQSIESNEASALELEDLGHTDAAAQRWIFVDVQVALLARLTALHTRETIGWTHALVSPAQLAQTSQQPERHHRVCWPIASNSDESTKRSMLDDVRLSASSGSLHSAFSASASSSSSPSSSASIATARTAPSKRHLHRMDADDPIRTLTSGDLVELLAHGDGADDKATTPAATAGAGNSDSGHGEATHTKTS